MRLVLRTAAAARAAAAPEAFERAGTAEACWSPVTDARDGTRLVLVRSRAGRGDYAVPEGRYGVREGELPRLECATGRVLGIVPRG